MSEPKISMKLLIDKSKSRVLFAEARKECVDFFLHILSLPLATVVGFLSKESMVGSLGSLYGSFQKIESDYLQDGLNKDRLLKPNPASGSASNVVPLLSIDKAPEDPYSKLVYICNNASKYDYYCNDVHLYVSDTLGALCPYCCRPMNKTLTRVAPTTVEAKTSSNSTSSSSSSNVGGYVKGVVTYIIMDDLSVEPMSTISGITLLNKFNIHDVGCLDEKLFTVDMKQAVELLKASLVSKTVLTDVFLGKK